MYFKPVLDFNIVKRIKTYEKYRNLYCCQAKIPENYYDPAESIVPLYMVFETYTNILLMDETDCCIGKFLRYFVIPFCRDSDQSIAKNRRRCCIALWPYSLFPPCCAGAEPFVLVNGDGIFKRIDSDTKNTKRKVR